MPEPPRDPGRRQLPHFPPVEIGNRTIMLFITVCVTRRRPLLAHPEIATVLVNAWRRADHWLVGRYVIMPDHVHLFCAPAKFPLTPIKPWVDFWCSQAARHWPRPKEKPLWQRDFVDHQVRSGR